MKMNKLAYYIRLLKLIRQMREGKEILKNPAAYGNLAYFLEQYMDEKGFSDLWKQIGEAVEKEDANLLCWKLYQWIYEARLEELEAAGGAKEEELSFMEFERGLVKDSYQNGNCRTFWIAPKEAFPDWFYEYLSVKTAAGEEL